MAPEIIELTEKLLDPALPISTAECCQVAEELDRLSKIEREYHRTKIAARQFQKSSDGDEWGEGTIIFKMADHIDRLSIALRASAGVIKIDNFPLLKRDIAAALCPMT